MKIFIKYLLLSLLVISFASCSDDGIDGINGIDGTDGINGTDGVNGSNSSGLTYVYFSGNITDAEALTKIQNEVGSTTQFIYVNNTTQLTTLDLSGVTELVTIEIRNNAALTTLNLSNLVNVNQTFYFENNPLVSSLVLSSLVNVSTQLLIKGSATINSTSLQQVNISNLTNTDTFILYNTNVSTLNLNNSLQINVTCQIDYNHYITSINLSGLTSCDVSISNNNSLINVALTSLTSSNSLGIFLNNVLTTIDLSSLVNSEQLYVAGNMQIASINLPQFTNTTGNFIISGNINLNSLSMPLLNEFYYLDLSANNFNSAYINSFLSQLVAFSPAIFSKFIYLQDQQIAAPPTGQGITDYNTLTSNSNYITTD